MKNEINGQFIRYVIVGLISNGLIYFIYLFLTAYGLSPKIAMSLLYLVGVVQTFFFNRKWSFRFNGPMASSLIRYLLAYAGGYLLNMIILIILVDHVGFSHQIIQGLTILLIAIFLFIAQKLWVFPQPTHEEAV